METSTRPVRDRKARTRLEDDEVYEVSFKTHTTRKYTKKASNSASKSSAKDSLRVTPEPPKASKASKKGILGTFLTNVGEKTATIQASSDEDSFASLSQTFRRLSTTQTSTPNNSRRQSSPSEPASSPSPEPTTELRPLPQVIYHLYVRKGQKDWIKGIAQGVIDLNPSFRDIIGYLKDRVIQRVGKGIKYPEQVNIEFSTRWASSSKGTVVTGKKDPINMNVFSELNEFSLPALVGIVRGSMKRNGQVGNNQLYIYATVEDIVERSQDSDTGEPELAEEEGSDKERRVFSCERWLINRLQPVHNFRISGS
jgi:hypothetical protein